MDSNPKVLQILESTILRQVRFSKFRETSGMSGPGFVLNCCWGESASCSILSMAAKTKPFGLISVWEDCCYVKEFCKFVNNPANDVVFMRISGILSLAA